MEVRLIEIKWKMIIFCSKFIAIVEDGLKKAKLATSALYDGDFAALSSLSAIEMKSIFTGAKVYDVLLEPGMTILDLALKANIYKNNRKFIHKFSIFDSSHNIPYFNR